VQALPMNVVARSLSQQLGGSIVENQTRLTGNYDLHLQWTPDNAAPTTVGPPGLPPPGNLPAPDPGGPSLQTALQEQLGLKLEQRKVPIPVLVVDDIEPPSEN
jgi:uncharacterized protein (TIGR03435 family)